jgi:CspA family cold shock protein
MTKGKVKWYNETKGFGFIETENSDDIFVHRTGLENSWDGLMPDQEVEFEIEQGDKGLKAVNVKLV